MRLLFFRLSFDTRRMIGCTACSVRTASQKNLEVLLDHSGFQSNNVPVYDRVLKLNSKISKILSLENAVNDNNRLKPEQRAS